MIQAYFDNIQKVILSKLHSAQKTVMVAVAWFTNKLFFDELLKAQVRGVNIKVLIHDDILNRSEFGLDFGKLIIHGTDVRFLSSCIGIMHHKFCIIDDIVITGSYNWTYYANSNHENIIITDELDVVESYADQFNKIFCGVSPILLPYEHLKWTDIKETDYYDLRGDLFRDVYTRNDDDDDELKRIKLINLDNAYKKKNAKELQNASLLPIESHLRTISDVLINRGHDYTFKLWEESISCEAKNVHGYIQLGTWYYEPVALMEDNNHHEYIEGYLITAAERYEVQSGGLKLKVYDSDFISTIKKILNGRDITDQTIEEIPDKVLCIEYAKMFFYPFTIPKSNKLNSKTFRNNMNRKIPGIDVLGIAKDINNENVTFYEGWDPQERGKKIEKEFFE